MWRGIGEDLGVESAGFDDRLSVGENNMERMEESESGTQVSQGGKWVSDSH